MTRDETKKILAVLDSVFHNANLKNSNTVDVWASVLEPYPYEAVSEATYTYLRTDTKDWPTPAKILQYLPKGEELSPAEAWGMVYKAICNSAYNQEAEFNKLPPDIQRAVGSPGALHEWAIGDISSLTVVESLFYKKYEGVKIQKRNDLLLGMTQRKEIGVND